MPMSRPRQYEENPGVRRALRNVPEFKRTRSNGNGNHRQNRAAPPEVTNAENYYYVKQMNSKTPMVVVLTDGEEIRGCIEWYDRSSIKVNREGAPNLLIQKHCIKYLFKEEELG
jgi:sRNA-binding regulator protein Hfq